MSENSDCGLVPTTVVVVVVCLFVCLFFQLLVVYSYIYRSAFENIVSFSFDTIAVKKSS